MGIIAWIIFGLIAGAIAKLIMPGNDGGGFILTCVLGVVGAVVGGWLARCLALVAALAVLTCTVSWWLSWVPLWCWAFSGYCDGHNFTKTALKEGRFFTCILIC
ncbi:transglycosylase [Enterobacter ludwigii]|nr:transglycosylase [Enterobacter ludwigii]